MANQIPLATSPDEAGGHIVLTDHLQTLQQGIERIQAFPALSSQQTTNSSNARFPVYMGRPVAGFTDEAAEKNVDGAEYGELTCNIQKLSCIVILTEELVADAREDPSILISQDVAASFAGLIDAHTIGESNGSAITGKFDTELVGTTQSVALPAGGDGLAKGISQAMALCEANGYMPNGVAIASNFKGVMRDSRHTVETAAPVYSEGYTAPVESIYGLGLRWTSNLAPTVPTPLAGETVAIVGDFSQLKTVWRRRLVARMSTEATVGAHNLWSQNKLGLLWEARVGVVANDLNRAFAKVVGA